MKRPTDVVVAFRFSTRDKWPTVHTSDEEAKEILEIPDSLLELPLESVETYYVSGQINAVTATFCDE